MQTHALRRLTLVASLAGALLVGACGDFNVTNPNQPTLEGLVNSPTRTTLAVAATGLLVGIRVDMDDYIWRLGSMGREGVNLSGNNQPDYQEPYFGPLQGTGFGAALWANEYREVLNANTYLTAVPKATQATGVEALSSAEVSASLGFGKTLKALALLYVVTSHGSLGAPVDVNQPVTAPPAPFVSEDSVYGFIIATLNDAQNNLAAGGGAFPFTLPAGYTGFDTPATFLAFNRALAAKAYIFRATALHSTCGPTACYTAALTALGQAAPVFGAGDPTKFKTGVYIDYSPGAGDVSNPLSDALDAPNFFALPLLIDQAQKQTGGEPDDRAVIKIAPQTAGTPQQLGGIGILGTHKFTIYLTADSQPNPSAPIPVIRSEELVLLKAEAEIGLNQLGPAAADIDIVRTNAGKLPSLGGTFGATDPITELLYNRKYSLLWEQGATWVDARRYGRLNTIPIPPGFSNSTPPNNNFGASNVPTRLLVPDDECRSRGLEPGCNPLGT